MAKEITTKAKAETGTSAGGGGGKTGKGPSPATMKELAARFGEIVAVLMRSPVYRHVSVADLEWVVMPPLLSGQFSIMSAPRGNQEAMPTPVGLAFWAMVSPEVDAKLEAQKKAGLVPFRLGPREWKSGDIVWLLDMIALPMVRQQFREKLQDGVFKGRPVKRYFEHPEPPPANAPATAKTQ